jgi:hypothetical protein
MRALSNGIVKPVGGAIPQLLCSSWAIPLSAGRRSMVMSVCDLRLTQSDQVQEQHHRQKVYRACYRTHDHSPLLREVICTSWCSPWRHVSSVARNVTAPSVLEMGGAPSSALRERSSFFALRTIPRTGVRLFAKGDRRPGEGRPPAIAASAAIDPWASWWWLRLVMMIIDPNTIRATTKMPKARARKLLV